MKNNESLDDRLEALLARKAVSATGTFADQTLARLAAYEAEEDAHLDALLSRRAVKTGDAFTEKTLARLAAEPAEEKLDKLLAAQVVEASPGFTSETLERGRHETGSTHRQRWFASVAGLAAAVAIAFVTTLPPGQPATIGTMPTPVVSPVEFTAASSEATTHKALALANGLSGADGLLDGETMELLVLLSDQPDI